MLLGLLRRLLRHRRTDVLEESVNMVGRRVVRQLCRRIPLLVEILVVGRGIAPRKEFVDVCAVVFHIREGHKSEDGIGSDWTQPLESAG
jgi:hypothetical protein